MPLLNGIDASRMLKRLMPATPVIMFTTFTDPHIASAAFAAGVHAVVNKSEGATTLIGSIQRLFKAELPPHARPELRELSTVQLAVRLARQFLQGPRN
jgi:DNA-binding NarL/FixJ family response regulator